MVGLFDVLSSLCFNPRCDVRLRLKLLTFKHAETVIEMETSNTSIE